MRAQAGLDVIGVLGQVLSRFGHVRLALGTGRRRVQRLFEHRGVPALAPAATVAPGEVWQLVVPSVLEEGVVAELQRHPLGIIGGPLLLGGRSRVRTHEAPLVDAAAQAGAVAIGV